MMQSAVPETGPDHKRKADFAMRTDRKKLKYLLIAIAVPLAVGGLAALLTKNSMDIYDDIVKPAFAPPGKLFPFVWGALYLLILYKTRK